MQRMSVCCGTSVYVVNPYLIPVTQWYIPEEWRAENLSFWRLEGSVKYQYLALSPHCLVQWRTEGGFWGVQTPRNSEDIGGVLDRMSKKNRRLDFLL